MTPYLLLAEDAPAAGPTTTSTATPTSPVGPDQTQSSPWTLPVMMLLAFGVLYFLLIRPQRQKEKDRQKHREDMIKNLKKSDHVMTIGGMHGIVASVTATEVVLKVDEKNDVRVRFTRDAISKVVTEEDEKQAEGKRLDENPEGNK